MMRASIMLAMSLLTSLSLAQQVVVRQDMGRAFAQMSVYKSANISLQVIDLASGEVIVDHRAQKLATPASVMKLVSTALAYEVLGPDFRFETSLAMSGQIQEDGTLSGGLTWIGTGDPSFGSSRMYETDELDDILAKAISDISSRGISCIDGPVSVSLSGYSTQGIKDGWPYQDIANYYGAGLYGLNVLDNQYTLRLRQNSTVGKSVEIIGTQPQLNLEWSSELTSGPARSGDQAYIYGDPYSHERRLRGTIPIGAGEFKIYGSLPDPPQYFLDRWLQKLTDADIATGLSRIDPNHDSQELKVISTYPSPALSDLIRYTLRESDNLYAEGLLEAARRSGKKIGIKEYLVNHSSKATSFPRDGSGLSPNNALTAKSICDLIYHLAKTQPKFLELLPAPEETKTLKRYTASIPSAAIRAKTGSMSQVRAIAGTLTTKSNKRVGFAILINNYRGTSAEVYSSIDSLLKELYLSY